MHWAEQYIGKLWVNGARGPDAFDCWGLVWWIYRRHYGIELPAYPNIHAKDKHEVSRLIREAIFSPASHWMPQYPPADGCAVAMGAKHLTHVGIYLDIDGGLIMHAVEKDNVRAQPLSALRHLPRLEFFKWLP